MEEGIKVSILLTVVGDEFFELIVNLCNPDKSENKTYAELVEVVRTHLLPEPWIPTERFKLRQRKQTPT